MTEVWTTVLQSIEGSDDLLLTLPPALLARHGWQVGDDLLMTLVDADPPYLTLRTYHPPAPDEATPTDGGLGGTE